MTQHQQAPLRPEQLRRFSGTAIDLLVPLAVVLGAHLVFIEEVPHVVARALVAFALVWYSARVLAEGLGAGFVGRSLTATRVVDRGGENTIGVLRASLRLPLDALDLAASLFSRLDGPSPASFADRLTASAVVVRGDRAIRPATPASSASGVVRTPLAIRLAIVAGWTSLVSSAIALDASGEIVREPTWVVVFLPVGFAAWLSVRVLRARVAVGPEAVFVRGSVTASVPRAAIQSVDLVRSGPFGVWKLHVLVLTDGTRVPMDATLRFGRPVELGAIRATGM